MKKAIIACVVLFGISLFSTIVSFVACGGELIKVGIEYGIEYYREYKQTENVNDISDLIEIAENVI